jgi:hypothetical protein
MTADEIRKNFKVQGTLPLEMLGDLALLEIAAQLAELNETLRKLADKETER